VEEIPHWESESEAVGHMSEREDEEGEGEGISGFTLLAREEEADGGCIRTRIFPPSEGEVSKEMSKSPRLGKESVPVPANSSLRVVPVLSCRVGTSASRSIREEVVGFDQS
jgi:hypothetical protein